jgi:hypothetical protein
MSPVSGEAKPLRWLLGAAGLLAVLLLVLNLPSCSKAPPVSSAESLQLAKLIYAACNTKDAKRLAMAEEKLRALQSAKQIGTDEQKAYEAILADARAGAWQKAADAAYAFSRDQVRD